MPSALKEGFIDVDEMELTDLLAMSADYAGLLKFTNMDNESDSDWSDFLSSDEATIMSMILTTDLKKIESEFFSFLHDPDSHLKGSYDLKGIPTYRLAKKIDLWFKRLKVSANPQGRDLWQKIAALIEKKLRSELDILLELSKGSLTEQSGDVVQRIKGDFDAFWLSKEGAEKKINLFFFKPGEKKEQVERLWKSNFYSFYNAVAFFKDHSANLLPLSLENKLHSPAIGLFITFLKLFQKIQKKINGFTQKHLDFYCNDILNVGPRKTFSDSAYLGLLGDGYDKETLIKKGTRFLAGTDENKEEILYHADNDLLVRHIQIKDLYTLYFERDRLSSPENILKYITAGQLNRIPVLSETDSSLEEGLKSFPLFGAPKSAADKNYNKDAQIGFALASPVLLLKEGQRDISISFKIDCDSSGKGETLEGSLEKLSCKKKALCEEIKNDGYDLPLFSSPENSTEWLNELLTITDLYEKISTKKKLVFTGKAKKLKEQTESVRGQKFCDLSRENKGAIATLNRCMLELLYPQNCPKRDDEEETNKEDAFFKTFSKIFSIELTTEKGWYEVPEYLPLSGIFEEKINKETLKIQIQLPPDVDPVVPYSQEIHGGEYSTDLPLIRFIINPTAYLYPYSLLKDYIVKEIKLAVDVTGVRDVKIYNNLGQLDPNNPFNPFGPVPSAGSYFIVGNFESARKHLTRFELDVEWGDLPKGKGGFREYYGAYEGLYYNNLFKASLSALSGSEWKSYEENEQNKVNLFQTEKNDGSDKGWQIINKTSLLSCNEVIGFLKPSDRISTEEGFVCNSKTKDGFIKITLADPDYAFGHRDYANELTKVLTANARVKKPRFFKPVPNPPYTPLVNAISISYSAVATLNPEQITSSDDTLAKERFYHIHPFGLEHLLPGKQRNFNMLPQYDFDGNLFIGLDAKELDGILTLFFHLCEDSSPDAGGEPSEFVWHYLSSNQWKKLEKRHVLSDTTCGFLSSGIVTLDIPEGAGKKNTIMPSGLFWLRASVDNRPERWCSLYSVRTNAIKVSRYYDGNRSNKQAITLPPGTIQKPKSSIPGIAEVTQVMESFSDSLPENRDQFLRRVTERVRHKNRAVTEWDYERLILEQFPELFKVKCFASMVDDPRPEYRMCPGNVLIVIIPSLQRGSLVNVNPMVSDLVLKKVREFAEKLSSPFIQITVRNPDYEQIQIRCAVKFSKGMSGGYYINLLNDAITDYLSPWSSRGSGARFGWCVRSHDIMSFIGNQEFVDFVTDFSMLHITSHDEDIFRLFDTVNEESRGKEANNIAPFYPWSIAVPMKKHFIETTDRCEPVQPGITGIGELEIAGTFIIS